MSMANRNGTTLTKTSKQNEEEGVEQQEKGGERDSWRAPRRWEEGKGEEGGEAVSAFRELMIQQSVLDHLKATSQGMQNNAKGNK